MSDPFVAENAFYLGCAPERFGKLLSQYELFKRVVDVPGAIVECGVFKGASLARWAMFRDLLSRPHAKPIVAFDTFGRFVDADTARDERLRSAIVASAGDQGISTDEMMRVLTAKRCEQYVELVAGDICETVPRYVREHPELKISLLNLDVDFFAASAVALEWLWPRLSQGAVLVLDDYGVFEGETRAVDEFFHGRAAIRKFPFAYSPSFVVIDEEDSRCA